MRRDFFVGAQHSGRGKMKALLSSHEPGMQLICTRTISFVDAETLADRTGREALFRNSDSFLLYLSDGETLPHMQERLFNLSARQALLWLNEDSDERGSFWA